LGPDPQLERPRDGGQRRGLHQAVHVADVWKGDRGASSKYAIITVLITILFTMFIARYRVARFFSVQHTKTGKIYQVTKNIPKGHKMYQMANNFPFKTLQNLPKLGFVGICCDFLFENISSGNPGWVPTYIIIDNVND
jgi:hypothetical protein